MLHEETLKTAAYCNHDLFVENVVVAVATASGYADPPEVKNWTSCDVKEGFEVAVRFQYCDCRGQVLFHHHQGWQHYQAVAVQVECICSHGRVRH